MQLPPLHLCSGSALHAGRACFGMHEKYIALFCTVEAIVVAFQLCYGWVAGSYSIGWFAFLCPSLDGLWCTLAVVWCHSMTMICPVTNSATQPLQPQLSSTSDESAQVPAAGIATIIADELEDEHRIYMEAFERFKLVRG